MKARRRAAGGARCPITGYGANHIFWGNNICYLLCIRNYLLGGVSVQRIFLLEGVRVICFSRRSICPKIYFREYPFKGVTAVCYEEKSNAGQHGGFGFQMVGEARTPKVDGTMMSSGITLPRWTMVGADPPRPPLESLSKPCVRYIDDLNPTPQNLSSKPQTPHPKPHTPNPTP